MRGGAYFKFWLIEWVLIQKGMLIRGKVPIQGFTVLSKLHLCFALAMQNVTSAERLQNVAV